jgi:hypothetical protein
MRCAEGRSQADKNKTRLKFRPGSVHGGHHALQLLQQCGGWAVLLLNFPDRLAEFAQPFRTGGGGEGGCRAQSLRGLGRSGARQLIGQIQHESPKITGIRKIVHAVPPQHRSPMPVMIITASQPDSTDIHCTKGAGDRAQSSLVLRRLPCLSLIRSETTWIPRM